MSATETQLPEGRLYLQKYVLPYSMWQFHSSPVNSWQCPALWSLQRKYLYCAPFKNIPEICAFLFVWEYDIVK